MQDPQGSLDPRLPVYELLAEPLQAAGYDAKTARARVLESLELVGLPLGLARPLPGGLLRWSAAAAGDRPRDHHPAPAARPGRTGVGAGRLGAGERAEPAGPGEGELGLAYLVVAHDLAVVRHIADRIAVMYLGPRGRDGPGGRAVRRAAAPVHPGAAVRGADPRPGPGTRRASGSCWPGSSPAPWTCLPAACLPTGARCDPTLAEDSAAPMSGRTPAPQPMPDGVEVACHAA